MIFGYTRVSTRDKQTDDLQRRALINAGVQKNAIFHDRISGAKAAWTRPGWSRLEASLRSGDELVIWRLDRLGRSMIDVVTTVDELVERGVAVRSVTDGLDPSTPQGRLMLGFMASFAEYERGLIQESVQAGVDAAKARGVRFGRPPVDPEETARKVRLVERAVETEGMTVEAAAWMVGWSRSTYYRRRVQHPASGQLTAEGSGSRAPSENRS